MSKQLIRATKESNYETAAWILGLEGDDKQKIKDFILNHGLKSFLLEHQRLDLSELNQEKVEVLKRVLQKYDGDIEAINFGDVDTVD